jgi:hypothetical protein
MNKAFVAALACATTSAVKINAAAQDFDIHSITRRNVCNLSDEEKTQRF